MKTKKARKTVTYRSKPGRVARKSFAPVTGSPAVPRWGAERSSTGRIVMLVPVNGMGQCRASIARDTAKRLLRELAGALRENAQGQPQPPRASVDDTKTL